MAEMAQTLLGTTNKDCNKLVGRQLFPELSAGAAKFTGHEGVL